jgi:hypothetical protein
MRQRDANRHYRAEGTSSGVHILKAGLRVRDMYLPLGLGVYLRDNGPIVSRENQLLVVLSSLDDDPTGTVLNL